MKKDKYTAIYLNGNEMIFSCNGFNEAVVKAQAHAVAQGWDMRIKYIVDEKGTQIQDIEPATFKYSK